MALFPSSNTILNASNRDTQKSYTVLQKVRFTSLKPGTKHDLYIDGVLHNWSARPFGKNLGDDLITDDLGTISFQVLLEFYYSGSYSYDQNLHQVNILTGKNVEDNSKSYYTTTKLIEIKAPGSRGYMNIPMRILVSGGDPNTIEPHAH